MAVQYKEQVGEVLRARRDELGLTQPQVAERVEAYLRKIGKRQPGNPFPVQTISRWERGQNLAIADNLEAVAAALESTPGELLSRIVPENGRPKSSSQTQLDRLEELLVRVEGKLDALLSDDTATGEGEEPDEEHPATG